MIFCRINCIIPHIYVHNIQIYERTFSTKHNLRLMESPTAMTLSIMSAAASGDVSTNEEIRAQGQVRDLCYLIISFILF